MILEIARFWASLTTYNSARERYEIRGVMGPDEYHDRPPGADAPGLNNNAYTNIMAVWTLQCGLKVFDLLAPDRRQELCHTLHLRDEELVRWREITCKMRIGFHDGGIISQFEGYEAFEEFDWEGYGQRYGDIQRLDRILEAEEDTPNRYKISKQADVLMLFYLFSADELSALFKQLGYPFASETIPNNVDEVELGRHTWLAPRGFPKALPKPDKHLSAHPAIPPDPYVFLEHMSLCGLQGDTLCTELLLYSVDRYLT